MASATLPPTGCWSLARALLALFEPSAIEKFSFWLCLWLCPHRRPHVAGARHLWRAFTPSAGPSRQLAHPKLCRLRIMLRELPGGLEDLMHARTDRHVCWHPAAQRMVLFDALLCLTRCLTSRLQKLSLSSRPLCHSDICGLHRL